MGNSTRDEGTHCTHAEGGRCGYPSHGFSLIDVLATLAILAILATIVIPLVGIAREESRRTTCLGNLRQMAVAANAYAMDNVDQYPIAYFTTVQNGATTFYCWDLTTIYVGGQPTVVPGLLWQGLAAERILQCPSFDGGGNWLVDPYTGYNYNTSYIGHGQFEDRVAPARVGQVHHPGTTALFGDGQYGAGANKFMRAPWRNPGDAGFDGRWSGTQGFRHRGQTNVAFCDGHAESVRDVFTANQDDAANVAPGTGFLSADNSAYSTD